MRRPLGARSAGSRRLLSGRSAGPRRLSAQHPGRTGAAPQAHRGVYIDSFGSFVLNYAYAEHLEKAELKKDQRDFTEVYNVYDRFFGVLRANLARLSVVPEPETPAQEPTADANDELSERKKQYSNAWINYMRFARRAQGHKACRDAFGKARKDPFVGWEVYEAAGVSDGISLHMDDGRSVAARIFETGMKMFGYDVAYVLSHLSFLLTVNDENNARALFERVIGTFPPAEAKPIWERWSRSQYQYDDLEAVLELERRMAEVYPNGAFSRLSLSSDTIVSKFNANFFLSPVFNTENLMDKSRTAVIPSSSARARSPPPQPPPRSSGRPPPDYGPYQGPQSIPRGGRGRY
ncbi:hypothetical protein C8R43DRAFT_1203263 [Mycena crocata]|nr:hypothetical protein C8R43DRAFT_1169983 [Mycena crocata]KAJ7136544.1 hypothetical protein C8R43DRAFT_1203263 [Mycena crocata]